jgi:hypothetical protein
MVYKVKIAFMLIIIIIIIIMVTSMPNVDKIVLITNETNVTVFAIPTQFTMC